MNKNKSLGDEALNQLLILLVGAEYGLMFISAHMADQKIITPHPPPSCCHFRSLPIPIPYSYSYPLILSLLPIPTPYSYSYSYLPIPTPYSYLPIPYSYLPIPYSYLPISLSPIPIPNSYSYPLILSLLPIPISHSYSYSYLPILYLVRHTLESRELTYNNCDYSNLHL